MVQENQSGKKYRLCVCGYEGNRIDGEWCCFNDSCGSNKPQGRTANIAVNDVCAELKVELVGKKKNKAAVDLVMGIVEGELKKNAKHKT
jgi:hypothetical protein